ncbi:MAG: glycosyltransferase, partial [Candidatus Chisholmbacteria bacterium]|nr:glycosyltransferase [Candidatus Chisholmbacteria bacterium]
MTDLKALDIIVPVKNEAATAEELVRRVDRACRAAGINYRLIVIDDRSTDETAERFQALARTYPVVFRPKYGKPGKAFSVIEGAQFARTEYVAMIDGDLQYPPEALPEMIKLAPQHGVVVANRKVYQGSFLRKLASRLNAWVFGKMIFGFSCDIQSGLKVFRRELIQHVEPTYLSAWTLDLPLLHAAEGMGYSIGSVDIAFTQRRNGESKIGLMRTAGQIAYRALKLKLTHSGVFHFRSEDSKTMLGAGIAYRKQRYVTHSHLTQEQSALVTFKTPQKLFFGGVLIALVVGLYAQPLSTSIMAITILSVIYFLDVVFNLYVTLRGLTKPPELKTLDKQLEQLDERLLPVYSILCPLYQEAHMLPEFVAAIDSLEWPKKKLEVLLLLEETDTETIEAARAMQLPPYFKIVVVPNSSPQTKPKACNYGLAKASGEYVVIYDAEDRPDPLQLKKAYLGFQFSPPDVACLQAKLNYHNPHHNLLTKLFTAEYSLWFDVILPGLQSIHTSIPLGGTSNHFKAKTLRELGGWDAFNVTEDCDLGVRLFTAGYKTAIIDSVTLEEANSQIGNWVRQRSRWLKGYLQTYLVHMRTPWAFFRAHGWHALIFQLIVGLRISFILINPILWAATISYFMLYRYVGPTIEALYPTAVFYVAAFSLLVGNFTYLYNYMIGCAKREHWGVVKYVFLVPFYWLLMGVAALMAVFQLVFKPHYWEKTHHGFHLAKEAAQQARDQKAAEAQEAREERGRSLGRLATSGMATGGVLVVASVVANFLNFVYNAYLGRTLNLEDFGLLSVFGSIFYLTQSGFSALSATVTHRSA